MFESNYNYVPNPYPPAPAPGPVPQPGWYPPPHPMPGPPGPMPQPIFIDNTLSIPGAAADAAVTGKLIASKVSLDSLQGNIQIINGKLELIGMAEAEEGQVPSKDSEGNITWITPAREEDITNIQNQIDSINSELTEVNSNISQLFATNASQTEAIANLTNLVTNNNSKVEAIETQITELSEEVANIAESKLDKELFQAFMEEYSETLAEIREGLDELEASVAELQSCCEDVHNTLNQVLGDPVNYTQPLYQTLQDFETHAQTVNRDFDGGDLDDPFVEEVEVPNLIGKKAALANLILAQLGLFTDASWDGTSYEDEVVIAQTPFAGESAPKGSIVELQLMGGEEISG